MLYLFYQVFCNTAITFWRNKCLVRHLRCCRPKEEECPSHPSFLHTLRNYSLLTSLGQAALRKHKQQNAGKNGSKNDIRQGQAKISIKKQKFAKYRNRILKLEIQRVVSYYNTMLVSSIVQIKCDEINMFRIVVGFYSDQFRDCI